ncbi:MAG TPA: aminotransferase class I/II-fold pyridoxal phosphate-dependent enzyme, partial [Firmicutes bacterium]|nr:aminotransferase class I/II-fold pyridoxal phosphate-dependent enzyme [Bacillota bacterium]
NDFLPDFDTIPENVYSRTKLMFLNYPNNPTSACADFTFFEKALFYAEKYDFVIVQDMAYSEIYFYEPPVSMLEIEGAKKRVIEYYSLSKTYNMTGWRIGFAAGGAELIKGLATVKDNMDSGPFTAIQETAAFALYNCGEESAGIRELYKRRAELFYKGLTGLGYEVLEPRATLYLWIKVPEGYTSMQFSSKLLDEADIVMTPGIGFGDSADSYVRIALTVEEDRINQALDRISKLKK